MGILIGFTATFVLSLVFAAKTAIGDVDRLTALAAADMSKDETERW